MAYCPSTGESRKNMEFAQAARNQELRDGFATNALVAIIISPSQQRTVQDHAMSGICEGDPYKVAAWLAYEFADAMLAAREK